MAKKIHNIAIINGPNLNLLGTREPHIYGTETLQDIEKTCTAEAERLGFSLTCHQSNHEGELVDIIQACRGDCDAIIINAAAYSHTSVAIADALKATDLPVVEVHLSNIYKREAFRHHSFVSAGAVGIVCGFGSYGYIAALQFLSQYKG